MRRATASALIGLSAMLGTGIGLLPRTQMCACAEFPASTITIQREPSDLRQRSVTGVSEQKPDEKHSRLDGDDRVRRTSGDLLIAEALHLPPLPSRVLPEQRARSVRVAHDKRSSLLPSPFDQPTQDERRNALPSPPAPSKTLPSTVPERASGRLSAVGETESFEL
jgi:hypothetical protein